MGMGVRDSTHALFSNDRPYSTPSFECARLSCFECTHQHLSEDIWTGVPYFLVIREGRTCTPLPEEPDRARLLLSLCTVGHNRRISQLSIPLRGGDFEFITGLT
jgi:hypothetical protein